MSSLKRLQSIVSQRGTITIAQESKQLRSLKDQIDDLISIRKLSPVTEGSGSMSGIRCPSNIIITNTSNLSYSDLENIANKLPTCICDAVSDDTAYCGSRTLACPCNTQIIQCNCNTRTPAVCDCQSRTSVAGCSGQILSIITCGSRVNANICDCVSRTGVDACTGYSCGDCRRDDGGCKITGSCSCNGRTGVSACTCNIVDTTCQCNVVNNTCNGNGAVAACTCLARTDGCDCVVRTSSCGSRDAVSCQCNSRCTCNVERRFT